MKSKESSREISKPKVSKINENFFQYGYYGMILLFITLIILGLSGVFHYIIHQIIVTSSELIFYWGWLAYANPHNSLGIIAAFLIGFAITLCGFFFLRFQKFYQLEFSFSQNRIFRIVSICHFAFPWWLFMAQIFQFSPLVWSVGSYRWMVYWVPGPLYPLFIVLQIVGFVLIGVVLLLWAGVFLMLRGIFIRQSLAIIAVILFIITTLTILILFPGYFWSGPPLIEVIPPWIPYPWPIPYLGFIIIATIAGPACLLYATLLRGGKSEVALFD